MKRAAFALAALAACGKIDTREAEEKVKQLAEASTHAQVGSVDCPSAERKKGVVFECKVRFKEGGEQAMRVSLSDDNGDFEPAWVTQVVSKTYLGTQLTAHEGQKYDCGTGVVTTPVDVPCKSDPRTITVHVDENGDASW